MTLVSVIIPTYYRNDTLRAALDSVREQIYDPIEVIVVDDSGEQYAQEVVASIEAEITYLAHDSNQGAHAARDTGLQLADGDYIQFLDDDDRLRSEKIAKQIDLLEKREEVGVAYCGLVYEDERVHMPDSDVQGDVLEDILRFYDHPLTTSTMLIDAAILDEIQPLYRDSNGAGDIRMSIECAKLTQFDFVDEILVTAGRSENSLGVSWGSINDRWNILGEYESLYDDVPTEVRHEAIAEIYQLQGRRYLDDRIWSLAAIYSFGQALRYSPDVTPLHIGEFISSFGGRPGRELARLLVQ